MENRILSGLEDALKIANCQHDKALPFSDAGRVYWACASCGARFSDTPNRPLWKPTPPVQA